MIRKLLMTMLMFGLSALSTIAGDGDAPDGRSARDPTQFNVGGTASESKSGFALSSPEVVDGGMLPKDYTGDGSSSTLPLEWAGAPKGTRSFAVYALSAAPQLNVAPDKVSREVLLSEMKDKTLATGELHVVYSRPDGSTSDADDSRPPPPSPPDKPDDRHEK